MTPERVLELGMQAGILESIDLLDSNQWRQDLIREVTIFANLILKEAQPQQSVVEPLSASPTAGMNIAQRILHVGGRNNAAGYVEFGSIQAVEALVRQVLRDLPPPPPAEPAVEPENHVGNSKFESWYSEYNASGKGDKQRARDAYAAGMGDPVYLSSPPPPAEVPWLSEDEIGRIFLKFEGSLQSLRDCASEIEKAYRRKAGL